MAVDFCHDAAAAAIEYLGGLDRPANAARVLVMGVQCGGSCRPEQPCTVRSLRQTGAWVDFYDPRLTEACCGGLRARGVRRLSPRDLRRYDMVILQPGCPEEDCRAVAGSARAVLDARPPQKDFCIKKGPVA